MMSKIPFLFLTTLACNDGKITAGDIESKDPAVDNSMPSDDGQAGEEDQGPEPERDEDTGLSEGEDAVDTESDTETTPVTPEETEETEETEDDGEVTLEDYVATYCEAFAVPCMGYPSVDSCVDSMMIAHFTDCAVTDMDALAECDAWVATIDCAETSWNPACDEFITCD